MNFKHPVTEVLNALAEFENVFLCRGCKNQIVRDEDSYCDICKTEQMERRVDAAREWN